MIHKVGDVRVIEKCDLTRITVVAKSLPSGEGMANVSDNDKNEYIHLSSKHYTYGTSFMAFRNTVR